MIHRNALARLIAVALVTICGCSPAFAVGQQSYYSSGDKTLYSPGYVPEISPGVPMGSAIAGPSAGGGAPANGNVVNGIFLPSPSSLTPAQTRALLLDLYGAAVTDQAYAPSTGLHAWQVFVATGGANPLLTNTVVSVKGTGAPGNLGGHFCQNPTTSIVWIQVFNLIPASVTLGTTRPLFEFPVLPGGDESVPIPAPGIGFDTAISVAATTTATGAAAPASGVPCSILFN